VRFWYIKFEDVVAGKQRDGDAPATIDTTEDAVNAEIYQRYAFKYRIAGPEPIATERLRQ
jgi:uncharacterized protein (UPF0276 family)